MFKAVLLFLFFITLCFIVTKFCVLARLIIWMHTNYFLLILTVALLNVFPPSEIMCCVFKFEWLWDEGINIDLIYILINEN